MSQHTRQIVNTSLESDQMVKRAKADRGSDQCHTKRLLNHVAVVSLEAYLHSLTQVDASLPGRREAEMAYYINAYNAMTLWGILHG